MSMDDTTLYYVLTQLQDATVDISAESKESRDKDGTLIKKFWTGKSGKHNWIDTDFIYSYAA